VSIKISYLDGLQFADAKRREQPFPPTAVLGFRSEVGVAKDRSAAANIDADRALIGFKDHVDIERCDILTGSKSCLHV
jgi:hypothetical protein